MSKADQRIRLLTIILLLYQYKKYITDYYRAFLYRNQFAANNVEGKYLTSELVVVDICVDAAASCGRRNRRFRPADVENTKTLTGGAALIAG